MIITEEKYYKEASGYITSNISNRKKKLSIEEQIGYMRDKKGIQFNLISEEQAMEFLEYNNYYFKLKAYAKNYYKNQETGRYSNLDFAYLQELSTLDALFRKHVLKIILDIEHFLKVKLLNDFVKNPNEDGYNIIERFFYNISPNCREDIQKKSNNHFTKNLLNSFNNNFPIWSTVELLSFGNLAELLDYYYSIYPNKEMKIIYRCLFPVKCLRNAAAHNNCLLNNLSMNTCAKIEPNERMLFEVSKISNISSKTRVKKMQNAVLHDFVSTLYVFNKIVSSQKVKEYTYKSLEEDFLLRLKRHKEYFIQNADIQSSFDFFEKTIDYFKINAYNN